MATGPVKLAILDDYSSIAEPYFQDLVSSSAISVESFPSTLNARTPEGHAALITRLQPFTIISSMRERTAFPASLLRALPNLKLLLTTGGRNAAIDVDAARELGIQAFGTAPRPNHVPNREATNEMTWALILGLAKKLAINDHAMKSDPTAWQSGLCMSLAGKTLGILGLGRLGVQCAVTGVLGFGMKVACWSSSLTQEKADEKAQERGLPKGTFKVVGKEELFQIADILSVHYVLSDRSRGIVGAKEFSLLKKNAFVVNTSRGPLIDDRALQTALEQGDIRGVGLDVFETEPLPANSQWRKQGYWGTEGRGEVLLSPHMGYMDEETMHNWYTQHAADVGRWVKGEKLNSPELR